MGRLLRIRDCGYVDAESNELVLFNGFQSRNRAGVHHKTHVRFYTEEDEAHGEVPTPYYRRGTADDFDIPFGRSGGNLTM